MVPRLSFSRVGKPRSPFPASRVPAIQATTSEATVSYVMKDSTIARIAGIREINPIDTNSSMYIILSFYLTAGPVSKQASPVLEIVKLTA